jgi:cell division protein FtsB
MGVSRRKLIIVLLIVALSLSVLFYLRGRAIASLQDELLKTQEIEERLLVENERLRALLARKDDLNYIEYLARRELGLIFPGEEKYILHGGKR